MTTSNFVVVVAATFEELRSLRGELESVLSADELARRATYSRPNAADEFGLARGMLRLLLGRETRLHAKQVRFAYGPAGKPTVEGVHFNLSHAAGLVAVAFGGETELGIDVESTDAVKAHDDLIAMAERHLGAALVAHLIATKDWDARRIQFLKAWTAREASLKCLGLSLSGSQVGHAEGLSADPITADVQTCPVLLPHCGYLGRVAIRNQRGSQCTIPAEISAVRFADWISRG